MAKQTFPMHLYWNELSKAFDLFSSNNLTCGSYFVYVGPVEAQAEVPENFDIRAALLKATQAELTKVRAEFTKRITDLTRQINELQAIELQEQA
jgi:hypothetical protein